jgi:N-acetylneuraminate synthase
MTAVAATIGNRLVGPGEPTYVIAELSGNHNGELARALRLIDAAADAGADAVKLQTYTAATLTIDSDAPAFRITGGTPWDDRRLYELYEQAATPWEWTADLFAHARERGLHVFSTPFDRTAIDHLEALDPVAHKVASFELVDLELLRAVGETGRPVIASTGMASADEIDEAVAVLRAAGASDLVLLRCNSAYPASPEEMDLRTIPDMVQRWNVPVGLSDHTLSGTATTVAVALGACAVEKHLTLSRAEPGPDSAFSLEPAELAVLVATIREVEATLGDVRYGPSPSEAKSLVFRRSLFVVEDLDAGDRLTRENVRSIRPGDGLAPRHLDEVVGARAARKIARGTPLSWDLIAR